MNIIALIIALIGFFSAIFTSSMNTYLLKTFRKKKIDMVLFFYRFSLDVALGFQNIVYLGFVILDSFFAEQLLNYQNLIFYLSLPASNIGAIRSIVTLSISIDRMVASYAPIFYHNYRQALPNLLILTIATVYGLAEDLVLYGFCDFQLSIPQNCIAFGCAINTCFFNYWTTHKTIIFALTFIFAILLCVKLFIFDNMGVQGAIIVTRINRLALIDAATVCIFDFLPSFLANQFSKNPFFSFQNIGPYGTATKLLGCAIEAFLVYRTMSKREQVQIIESSTEVVMRRRKITAVRVS